MENNLKWIIIKNDMTQKELAEQLGVSPQHLNNWVNGRTVPKLKTLLRMSRILNCTINDIYDKDGED